MSNSFLAFNNFIKEFVEISDAQIEDLNKKCEVVTFSKGHILMKAGEVQNSIFFMVKGFIENYIDTDGGDTKIYNFRMENMTVTGYASYNYNDQLRAIVNVRCLEDCIMIKVPFEVIRFVIENIKFGERLGRLIAENHIIEMVNYVVQRDTLSILDRYDSLEKLFPNIHQRIPQHKVASYLGITPVHLSNIKKKRQTN
jgi:CRP-like cAMP-binding protein